MCNAHVKLETPSGEAQNKQDRVSMGKEGRGKVPRNNTCCGILMYCDTVHLNSIALSLSNKARGLASGSRHTFQSSTLLGK